MDLPRACRGAAFKPSSPLSFWYLKFPGKTAGENWIFRVFAGVVAYKWSCHGFAAWKRHGKSSAFPELDLESANVIMGSIRPASIGNISLVIICLQLSMIQIAVAGNQYCYPKGNTNRFQISRKLEFIEDRIIPQTDGETVPEEGLNCKWKIFNDYLDGPVVVLTGFNSNEHSSRRRWTRSVGSKNQPQLMRYELHSQASNSSCTSTSTEDPKPVELKMLRVLHLSRGSNLRVSFRLTQESSLNTPGLRIRLIEPGFCCREVTNFNNNCYTISTVPRSLHEELDAMKEDSSVMRLASFNSSIALQNFVRESQRTRVGSGLNTRSKVPLNLTDNLRIGMFYYHRTMKIFYLDSSGEKCKMSEFKDANRLNFTVKASNSSVSCGSLRAAQQPGGGEAVGLVDFANCSQPLPALISFADAARSRCENSSDTVLTWLLKVHKSQEQKKENGRIEEMSNTLVAIAVIGIALLLVAAITFAIISVRLRKPFDNSTPLLKVKENLEQEAVPPAVEPLKKKKVESIIDVSL